MSYLFQVVLALLLMVFHGVRVLASGMKDKRYGAQLGMGKEYGARLAMGGANDGVEWDEE